MRVKEFLVKGNYDKWAKSGVNEQSEIFENGLSWWQSLVVAEVELKQSKTKQNKTKTKKKALLELKSEEMERSVLCVSFGFWKSQWLG